MQVFLANFASAPRWVFTRSLFFVGFFALGGARFASLLPTGVLVLVGGAVGAGAVAGAVFAQVAAAASGGARCRGGKTWVASLALCSIGICSTSCIP